MIPKIIHLCWLSGDPYPAKIEKCITSWKQYLPDYEIRLWDTNRFPLQESLFVKQAYEAKKYAFAADYIRFYALYHEGGIYLDSDVEVLKSFDELLHLPYFVGAEKAGTIEAAIMGAEKGNAWVKKCLDYYRDRPFILPDGSLDIHKLPEIMVEELSKTMQLRFIKLEESQKEESFTNPNEVVILPDDYFSPKLFDSREVIITPQTYAIHHYQNSWFSPKAKIYYRSRTWLIRLFGYKVVRTIEKLLIPSKR